MLTKPGTVKLREGSLTALVSSGGAGVPGDRRLEQQDGVPGLHRAAGGGLLRLEPGRGPPLPQELPQGGIHQQPYHCDW